jgi:hypothetical protein
MGGLPENFYEGMAMLVGFSLIGWCIIFGSSTNKPAARQAPTAVAGLRRRGTGSKLH